MLKLSSREIPVRRLSVAGGLYQLDRLFDPYELRSSIPWLSDNWWKILAMLQIMKRARYFRK